MAQQFKVGDIVQLKSGGPQMTVIDPNLNSYGNVGNVGCSWFAGAKNERGNFPPNALVLGSEEEKAKK
jgi:uncharacterized protein YodC (DUF2158 family)